ncbi:helix-turn-helix transcriptional regulator [Dyadobacter tibetensis]|uniref:helix-turn-helix transcriptional regulator n=1 Tax=Dyadobacter tibetensis TaxID=1211851 RepID=UPI001E2E85FB|nr:helix-turn-helix transcriptional regulator [Dyadobacter tibetensis]
MMRFVKYFPTPPLQPYIKHFIVSENDCALEYRVFPTAGLVMGFQYQGALSLVQDCGLSNLDAAGISGISDTYKTFRNSARIGTLLVFFSETGFAHFAASPAHELFDQSIALQDIFEKNHIIQVQEELSLAGTDIQRIQIMEHFLLSQRKDIQPDLLVQEAVSLINRCQGSLRIKELNKKLSISPSALEKRFRKVVGTTPKKFASIVRFNTVLENLSQAESLTELCYEHSFFDQAHFIKDFKQYAGVSPERFKKSF